MATGGRCSWPDRRPIRRATRTETFCASWKEARGTSAAILGTVPAYDPARAHDLVIDVLSGGVAAALPDIIVCENDALVLCTVDAIRHGLGLRGPEHIAVTGFDDVPQTGAPNCSLTTYRQPVAAMAEQLVAVSENHRKDTGHTGFRGNIGVRSSA